MSGVRVWFAAGGLLVVLGVLLLRWSLRRMRGEVAAELAAVVPVPACRLEAVTALIPRVRDEPDATAVLPRYREVRRG